MNKCPEIELTDNEIIVRFPENYKDTNRDKMIKICSMIDRIVKKHAK